MKSKQEQQQILSDLNHNTSTSQYHKIPFSDFVYTDGINDLINKCGCWWLISDLGIELNTNKFKDLPFLVVKIEVSDNETAIITIREDSDKPIIYEKKINYTDFPLKDFEFWIVDNVFLLRSEY